MPKPFLTPDDSALERDIIETMLQGLKVWRPDLSYPASHSDMQGCVRALLSMFEIKRRPLAVPLRLTCHECEGLGKFIKLVGVIHREITNCEKCRGRGWLPSEAR